MMRGSSSLFCLMVIFLLWTTPSFAFVQQQPQQDQHRHDHEFLPYGHVSHKREQAVAIVDVPADWQQRVREGHMLAAGGSEVTHASLYPFVGNGYLATNLFSPVLYVSGLFNGPRVSNGTVSHRAGLPSPANWNLTDMTTNPLYAIDFERAVIYHRSTNDNGTLALEQRWYAHQTLPHVLVMEVEVNNTGSEDTAVQFSPSVGPYNYSVDVSLSESPVPTINGTVWNGTIHTPETSAEGQLSYAIACNNVPASLAVAGNSVTRWSLVCAVYTQVEGDSEDPTPAAIWGQQIAYKARTDLLTMHIAAWQEVWSSRVEIGGNLHLAQAVNASYYYMLASVRDDWPWSLSPGGLASNGYNGHTFWDCETWMFPSLLLFHPNITKGLADYRYNHMFGAMEKAKSYHKGYQGLMFPWESAYSGEEACTLVAPEGDLEQHISGDIVFALRQQWYATGDLEWLRTVAYDIVTGVASFYASRAEINGAQVDINHVIPPDEYAYNISNSAFTNTVASLAIAFAREIASIMNVTVPKSWPAIEAGLVASIPFDSELNIHLEYDGYNTSGGQSSIIKQADVILLGFPLMVNMTPAVREADLVYYSNVMSLSGPAMTWGMTAIGFIDIGDFATAAAYFNQSYSNIQPPFNVWCETPTGGTTNFITGAGGFLQGVVYGYSGIRLLPTTMSFNPALPPETSFVRHKGLHYQGALIDIFYNATDMQFSLASADGETEMYVDVTGVGNNIEVTSSVQTFPLGMAQFHVLASGM
eukprot:TRINITY_DN11045_c0_g1_i1.p1 TRINITY_DN11045_c0_g1~~TRINITY_DN11045_c0_g1_i1.p1  ORF type:complete len:757 (+),score=166.06 TRINITY_DN11045_c0_g1_i1:169-2439(+)